MNIDSKYNVDVLPEDIEENIEKLVLGDIESFNIEGW